MKVIIKYNRGGRMGQVRLIMLSVLAGMALFVFACYMMVFFREVGISESEVWEAQRAEQEMMCR